MRYETAITLRYLRSPRTETALSFVTAVSLGGVVLGVGALVVALALMNGYRTNLTRAMAGALPHVTVIPAEGGGFADRERFAAALRRRVEPETVSPFVVHETLLQARGNATGASVRGVLLRGVSPEAEQEATDFLAFLDDGRPDWAQLTPDRRLTRARELLLTLRRRTAEGAVPALMSRSLAEKLGVSPGETVRPLQVPAEGAFTPRPGPVPLVLRGYFDTGISTFDDLAVVLDAAHLRAVLPEATLEYSLGLRLPRPLRAVEVAAQLRRASPLAGERFYVYSWLESNKGLFQVLQVQKTMLYLVLMLIVVLAFFGMIGALMMMVGEKTREIAILRALGATAGGIRRVFLTQGILVGVVGTVAGLAVGLGIVWVLDTFPVVEIPPGVYPGSDHIPVRIDWRDLLLVAGGTMVVCLAATVYPATRAMRMRPVDGLRQG